MYKVKLFVKSGFCGLASNKACGSAPYTLGVS